VKRGLNNARWGGALQVGLDLALVAAIAFACAHFTSALMAPRALAAPSHVAAPGSIDSTAIVSRHLFGGGDDRLMTVRMEGSGMRLLGVLAPGRAILAVGNERVRSYAPGETLSAGVILKEVHADHVLVTRDGAPERVGLDRRAARAALQPGANARR
jgi:type II secretory pathway component PulC